MINTTTRTFDYQDDKSSKFWEVTQTGNVVTVRYGKTGTQGQTQDKTFDDEAAAIKHTAKLIAEKTGKGYVERGGSQPASVETPEATTVATTDSAVLLSAEPTAKKVTTKTPAKATSTKAVKPVAPTKTKSPAQDPEATPESLLALLGKDDATNRLLAEHPRASAELLEKLSHSSDQATRQGVAGNPNTAPEIYVKLGQQFPKEFLANPALDLLLMIQPALMEEVPQALLIRLLKQADCPASLLTWAASHPQAKVQLAVAMNAQAPDQALGKLMASEHAAVRAAVSASSSSVDQAQDPEKAFEQALRDRLGSMKLGELDEAWSEGDIGLAQWGALPLAFRLAKAAKCDVFLTKAVVRILTHTSWTPGAIRTALSNDEGWSDLAKDANLPVPILEVLAHDSDGNVRRSVAANPSMPAALLEALAMDEDGGVRWNAAINPSTPAALLEALANDQNWSVRMNVAENPSTPLPLKVTLLEALAKDGDSWIFEKIASNPATPVGLLEALAKDSIWPVRRSVAKHPSTPVAALEALAKDSDKSVRLSVAKHPSTPVVALEALAKDSDESVRRSVAKHPSTPVAALEVLAKDTDWLVRLSVAEHTSKPVGVLEALAKDSDESVRTRIAEDASTPEAILEALANDTKSRVRSSVARNPSTPVAVLEILAKDKDGGVRYSVARSPSTPVAVLETLAKDKDGGVRSSVANNPSTPVAVLESLAKDPNEWTRRYIAENPSTPVAVLETLAKDVEMSVRGAVASQTKTPPEVLAKLATVKVADVLLKVVRNPNTPLPALLRLPASKASGVRAALCSHAHRSEDLCRTLWRDPSEDVRQALMRNPAIGSAVLDELALGIEWEADAVAMLKHPNLGTKSAQAIADKLFMSDPADSPWYRNELAKSRAEVQAAAKANMVLSYAGKNPNKAVLAKRPLAPIMALCAGPFVEPSRIVEVAGSTDWLVRVAVARNPGTPPNLIKKLSADAHPLVARVAQAALLKSQDAPISGGVQSEGSVDLSRATAEVLGRIPNTVGGISMFFADDVWCDQLSIGQVSWMALVRFPKMQSVLGSHETAVMIEAGVAFEKGVGTIGSGVRRWAANEPGCPVHVLQVLANDEKPTIVLATMRNPSLAQHEIAAARQRLLKLRGRQLLELLSYKTTPGDILQAKADSKDRDVRSCVAQHPSTPVAVLEALAKDTESDVRGNVASNPSTPAAVLEALAKDAESEVRCSVAVNPATPGAVLEVLAKDAESEVRCRVAWNPSTPAAVLEVLKNDSDSRVRLSWVMNPSMSVAVLETLAKDTDSDVRRNVTWNPSTPATVLEALAKDAESEVRCRVAWNPSTPVAVLEALAKESVFFVRSAVAVNPSTPVAVLEALAKDTWSEVRTGVAQNPSTPAAVLESLAKDREYQVRKKLAKNPSTPEAVLDALAKDTHLRDIVAQNPSMSTAVLGPAKDTDREALSARWRARLERTIQFEVATREGAITESRHPIGPTDLLRALQWLQCLDLDADNQALTKASRSKDWLIRLGVALHPSATEGILKLLRKDADSDVAKAASRRAAGSTTAA